MIARTIAITVAITISFTINSPLLLQVSQPFSLFCTSHAPGGEATLTRNASLLPFRSMDYFQASIETYERGETPDNAADVSRKLLKLYGDMAKLLVDQEEWEEASNLLRNAIEKRAGMLGESDAEVAHAKVGLAGCIVKIKGPLVKKRKSIPLHPSLISSSPLSPSSSLSPLLSFKQIVFY